MVKLRLTSNTNASGADEPVVFDGSGDSILIALAMIDQQVVNLLGFTLTDDMAMEWTDCIAKLKGGHTYYRECFSTPEDNFRIDVLED